MSNNNGESFLPTDYTAPKSNSDYLNKFPQGETKLRILSKPIIGWVYFDENKKPHRFTHLQKPVLTSNDIQVKHFWSLIVWNYNEHKIQIMDITQQTIQSRIEALSKNTIWGNPLDYDLIISKTGQDLTTKYQVDPVPHKPVNPKILEELAKKPINLNALYEGKDPFNTNPVNGKQEENTPLTRDEATKIINEVTGDGGDQSDLPF